MSSLLARIRNDSFWIHLFALLCMMTATVLMYAAARQGDKGLIEASIGIFILGNIVELVLP
jgi:hypothetical protein